jgi:hypothetical protein
MTAQFPAPKGIDARNVYLPIGTSPKPSSMHSHGEVTQGIGHFPSTAQFPVPKMERENHCAIPEITDNVSTTTAKQDSLLIKLKVWPFRSG